MWLVTFSNFYLVSVVMSSLARGVKIRQDEGLSCFFSLGCVVKATHNQLGVVQSLYDGKDVLL